MKQDTFMRYSLLLTVVFASPLVCGSAQATIVQGISLGSGTGLSGVSVLPVSITATDGPVSFTANFTVTGNENLTRSTDGIGVRDAADIRDRINPSQNTTIAFVNFTGVTGGTVMFDGFTATTFADLTSLNERADVTLGASTLSFFTDGQNAIPLTNGDIIVRGVTNLGVDSDFWLAGFSAQFTGVAAVPEPSAFGLLAFVGAGIAARRRRRK